MIANIIASVGRNGVNRKPDVELVQRLLNTKHLAPLALLKVDGNCGMQTIRAIEEFQRRFLKMTVPDGRVDAGGRTFQGLAGQTSASPAGGAKTLADGLAANGVTNGTAKANASAVLKALKDNGITSKRAQANILAQVKAECGFLPRTEGNYSAGRLLELYGPQQSRNKVRFTSLADAQAVVANGPEAVFDKIYGGRMGNTNPGDGYKYRGRGYIQLTGKDNYTRVGAGIRQDLLGNPDLANDPAVATKILLNFLGATPSNQSNLENINWVNAKVGPAASPASRASFANSIEAYI